MKKPLSPGGMAREGAILVLIFVSPGNLDVLAIPRAPSIVRTSLAGNAHALTLNRREFCGSVQSSRPRGSFHAFDPLDMDLVAQADYFQIPLKASISSVCAAKAGAVL